MENGKEIHIERIIYLLSARIEGKLSDEEQAELERWVEESESNRQLFDNLANEVYRRSVLSNWAPPAAEKLLSRLKSRIETKKRIRFGARISVAASLLLLILFAGYYFLAGNKGADGHITADAHSDLLPASNKAVLKTGYGKVFVLNNQKQGLISAQNAAVIDKTDSNAISYKGEGNGLINVHTPLYDTLSNPMGGNNYRLTLADGTKILLNTGTVIRFPEAFGSAGREVELINGEIYVEVVHNDKAPFRVTTNGLSITDIGTHFDVSAYNDDDAVKTTLAEGSVRVQQGSSSFILHPGQQAVSGKQNDKIYVSDADITGTLAWTTGLFHFDHADLKTVMKQLARWYNVEIVYEGQLPSVKITGEIYRNLKASEVFEGLNYLNVRFQVEGNKIIVKDK